MPVGECLLDPEIEKMKIALFQCGPLAPGGAEFVVHNTANELVSLGNEVIVFAGKPFLKQAPKAIYEMYSRAYRVHEFYCPIVKGLSRFWARWNLLKVVRSLGCDIVHAHTLHTSGHIAVSIRRMLNVPVLVTAHGEDIQVDREIGYGHRLIKRNDRNVRFALAHAHGASALSRGMADEMLAAGARKDRLWVVPNGVSLRNFQGIDPLVRARPYLFAMGRLVPKKGFNVLLRAFAEVLKRGIKGVDLVIAGDGPEKENLLGLSEELGIKDWVHLTGFLDEARKASALCGARLFICPSLREPFGLVILEAMAAGRAVIASDIDGIPDLIEPEKNGLLFEVGNASMLASHITRLLEGTRSDQMGLEGRRKAGEYSWGKVTESYLAVYEHLLNLMPRWSGN